MTGADLRHLQKLSPACVDTFGNSSHQPANPSNRQTHLVWFFALCQRTCSVKELNPFHTASASCRWDKDTDKTVLSSTDKTVKMKNNLYVPVGITNLIWFRRKKTAFRRLRWGRGLSFAAVNSMFNHSADDLDMTFCTVHGGVVIVKRD